MIESRFNSLGHSNSARSPFPITRPLQAQVPSVYLELSDDPQLRHLGLIALDGLLADRRLYERACELVGATPHLSGLIRLIATFDAPLRIFWIGHLVNLQIRV